MYVKGIIIREIQITKKKFNWEMDKTSKVLKDLFFLLLREITTSIPKRKKIVKEY